MDLGNYSSRDEAIREGIVSLGEGERDFVILEATQMVPPPLDAEDIINNYFESLANSTDYYSGEADAPEWLLAKEQQKVAESELQAFVVTWSKEWLTNNMPSPDIFGSTRNKEFISNTKPAVTETDASE